MNPQAQFCQNNDCPVRGKIGKGPITIHSRKEQRYNCNVCWTTFVECNGTALYGLKKDKDLFVIVHQHHLDQQELDLEQIQAGEIKVFQIAFRQRNLPISVSMEMRLPAACPEEPPQLPLTRSTLLSAK